MRIKKFTFLGILFLIPLVLGIENESNQTNDTLYINWTIEAKYYYFPEISIFYIKVILSVLMIFVVILSYGLYSDYKKKYAKQ